MRVLVLRLKAKSGSLRKFLRLHVAEATTPCYYTIGVQPRIPADISGMILDALIRNMCENNTCTAMAHSLPSPKPHMLSTSSSLPDIWGQGTCCSERIRQGSGSSGFRGRLCKMACLESHGSLRVLCSCRGGVTGKIDMQTNLKRGISEPTCSK